jgi:long-chain acyl-CoA synthetase
VLEAAVVGRPDPVLGEEPVAFVALRPGCDVTADDIVEHGRASLARYKVPRAVYIDEALPKNAVGKISKPDLRARLRNGSTVAGGGAGERPEIDSQAGR